MLVYVLGTAQDSGYPQANCYEKCCQEAWINDSLKRFPSSIAIIDQEKKKYWLIDVTPSLKEQLDLIKSFNCSLEGIFITHAHIGHYLGLLELGLEVMNTVYTPVYVMPIMKSFLEMNAPFLQLIKQGNIILNEIEENVPVYLNRNVSILPFKVPHRNEFSETVGYKIKSSKQSIIYIPDIDSWKDWDTDINDLIKNNDIIIIDGTFYKLNELKNRDVSIVSHPSIQESMKKFSKLDKIHRKKV